MVCRIFMIWLLLTTQVLLLLPLSLIFLFFKKNFLRFLLLFNYSYLHFHHTPPPHPNQNQSIPRLHPSPWFCPCVLYRSSCNPLSSLSPHHSFLAIVRLFLTTISLDIFCLLFSSVDYVPVKGEIIRYLSLTTCLISLSIMLSSSIHAVTKGRSSFFLLCSIPLCKYTIVFGSTRLLMGTSVASSIWLL